MLDNLINDYLQSLKDVADFDELLNELDRKI